jgi:ketosteroid isomerase-like protein
MPDDLRSAQAVVRDLYAKVAAGDLQGVLGLLADDCEFAQADSLPCGGRYVGRAGFQAMAARIFAAWPGFSVQPLAFLSDGAERVVVQTHLSGRGLDMPMLKLWTVRDGRVQRCQPFYFDTAVAAAQAGPGTPGA